MQNASYGAVLCVENTVVEDVEFDDQAQVSWRTSDHGDRVGVVRGLRIEGLLV